MPRVAILTGSKSDLPVLEPCVEALTKLGIEHEAQVMSAHRSPAKVQQFAATAAANGFEVIIAAAGMSAHLPGVVASMTTLPVTGVPLHTHPHEQTGYLVSGRCRFRLGDEIRELALGDTWIVPGGVEHEATALEPCVFVDVFSPPRDEYR